MVRRTVRVAARFFQDLDRQLPSERGQNGEPSANDFLVLDLLRAVEEFATNWEGLPELLQGRPDYRVLLTTGNVVPYLAVVGQLCTDGTIELLQLDVELGTDL